MMCLSLIIEEFPLGEKIKDQISRSSWYPSEFEAMLLRLTIESSLNSEDSSSNVPLIASH